MEIDLLNHELVRDLCIKFFPVQYSVWLQINKCKAWYTSGTTFINGVRFNCVGLKSYDTLVALAIYEERSDSWVVCIRDYYSPTTVKHIWKFIRIFEPEFVLYSYNRVYSYYRKSKVNKLVWNPDYNGYEKRIATEFNFEIGNSIIF